MAWDDLKMDLEKIDPRGRQRPEDDPNVDKDMQEFFRAAIALHHANAAFKTAEFEVVVADDQRNVFGFTRGTGADRRVVVLNRSNEPQTVALPAPAKEVVFVSRGTADAVKLSTTGEITLPPLTGVVLK
jgi:glycosidase